MGVSLSMRSHAANAQQISWDFNNFNDTNYSTIQTAKEKRSHANEGHKLAGKIKITKNMMNSHNNEKDRVKSMPQRTVSNESTESEGVREDEVDIDNI